MAFVVPILSAVGTVFGSVMQSGQQSAAAQAQANASYYNAAVAQQNADAAMQAAQANKQTQDRQNRAQMEQVRSKYLSSGIELEGTPLMVLEENASNLALESDRILHQGKVQQANYKNQANMQRYQGDVALSAGNQQASGTLLGGLFSGVSGVGRALYAGS
jgi:hypothetical protein